MSSHFHTPEYHNDDPSPNKSFRSWLKSEHSLYVTQILAIISGVGLFASVIYYLVHGVTEYITIPFIKTSVIYAHIFFITIFIIKLIKILNNTKESSYSSALAYKIIFNENIDPDVFKPKTRMSERTVKIFKKYFLCFWITMLALYLAFAFQNSATTKYLIANPNDTLQSTYQIVNRGDTTSPKSFTQVISSDFDEYGNINLTENDTVNLDKQIVATSSLDAFKHLLPEFLTFTMNCTSSMFIFWCFSLLVSPPQNKKAKKDQMLYVNFSILFVILLLFCYIIFLPVFAKIAEGYLDSTLKSYTTFFNAISGVFNCFVLALLIARLDSKLIGLKSKLIGILYLYASVQPLFVVFEEPGHVNDIIKTIVFIIVFMAKIYFFLIITYALQEERILNYMYCFPILDKRVNSVFRNQFEVTIKEKEDNKFRFEILEEKIVVYNSDLLYDSRDECLKDIKKMREIICDKSSFTINNISGTYWLKIIYDEITYCFSKNLDSEDEANHLIDESMSMIPYCKVNYS